MKKTFLSLLIVALCTLTSYAQQANIYASGLKAEQVEDAYAFSYTLNADASAVTIEVSNGDRFAITDAADLTKGAHTVTKQLSGATETGTYTWSVTAAGTANTAAAPVQVSNDDLPFLFYGPRGVAIDNSFESPYFGAIYVSEGASGKVEANLAADAPTRTTSKGIYVLSPGFEDLTPEGPHTGGQNWSASNSPYRLAVAPDGKVYVADYSASAHSGVYIMDPANTTSFTPVFGGTTAATGLATTGDGATIHGSVGHCYVLGTGANTQLFTYDWGAANTGDIYRYDIGDMSTTIPWTTAPSAIVYNDAQNGNRIQGGNCSIAPDNRGGWWICQYRYDNTVGIPSLIHITADGTLTNFGGAPYNVDIPGSYQAGMAVSLDGNLLAMGTSQGGSNMGRITVFDLTYADETNIPSFTKKYDITTVSGAYVIGAALDVAGNLYTVDNNKERLRIHALPKAENTFTTPAPATQSITYEAPAPAVPKPNIYASGLKAEHVSGTNYTLSYTLNTDAVSGGINFISGGTTISVPAPDPALLTKGAHSVTLDLGDLADGEYSWSITATAAANEGTEPVQFTGDQATLSFIYPRGLAIDNNTESPYFGRIYVADSDTTKKPNPEQKGLYLFNSDLSDAIGQGSVPLHKDVWTMSPASPMRITVAPDSKVYISDWSDNSSSGVYIMDPANPSADLIPVFGGSVDANGIATHEGATIHGSISHCWVEGTGAETKLYTFDEDIKVLDATGTMNIYRYDIGNATTPWITAPSAVTYDDVSNYQQNGCSMIIPDANGGWWISQDRATDNAAIPSLIHINAAGTVDYNSSGVLGGRTRGAIAFNADQSLLVSVGTNYFRVWDVTWNATTGEPSLTQKYQITSGLPDPCYNVILDVAGNIYGTSNSKPLIGFALPKSENTFTTPAPASQKIQIGQTGIKTPEAAVPEISIVSSDGSVRILAGGTKITGYTLYNLTGSRILNAKTASSAVEVPTGRLSAGVYLIQVTTDKGTVTKRFIK
jgi:sugar lactone lactonase YvrE